MNISATLNVFRLFSNPELCLPHLVVPTFAQLPVPISIPGQKPDLIKAVVLDKDNCFAKAHDDKVWPEYKEKWESLRKAYPGASLLIVSNSAGTNDDIGHKQAKILEERMGVSVLRHSTKKPGCNSEIMDYFIRNKVADGPHQVAVIGDRLFTDMLMANMMGSWGVWVNKGVVLSNSLICKIERKTYEHYKTILSAPIPKQFSK
ncbi:hypothetical protein B5S32_g4405 [[Candida] boidinii]|nr:hypothetical protein B5S32_g4405 [[Candida] boidinii]